MITLEIDSASCIRCGKCVKVCPAYILTQTRPKSAIGVEMLEHCIACGHCVAACPTDSIAHSEFPTERVHLLERATLPTPEQVLALCRARRSNRAFLPTPVPEALLQQIVEAAQLAPTARNAQEVGFTLVTDPALLRRIAELTIEEFERTVRQLTLPVVGKIISLVSEEARAALPHLQANVNRYRGGKDTILRGARALLFFHTPAGAGFGRQDANLAYQNASLMAESLGVSQFYTGYVCTAYDRDKQKKLAKLLNIDGTIHAGMAMAMPAFKFSKYIDRHDINLTRF